MNELDSYETEALGNLVFSKDACSPLDIGIVYFISNATCNS